MHIALKLCLLIYILEIKSHSKMSWGNPTLLQLIWFLCGLRFEATLPTLLSNYNLRDIFKADEFGLFYIAIPGKTLQQNKNQLEEINNEKENTIKSLEGQIHSLKEDIEHYRSNLYNKENISEHRSQLSREPPNTKYSSYKSEWP